MKNLDLPKIFPRNKYFAKYVASYGLDTSSFCHDLVANCNTARPVVTIGAVDMSGRSHQATVT